MIDAELLKILRCPETHQAFATASPELVEKLNARVASGDLKNRAGQVVREKISGGLIRADNEFVYPILQDLPILLVDEAIPINATGTRTT